VHLVGFIIKKFVTMHGNMNEQAVRSHVFSQSSVAERTTGTLDTNCTLVSKHFSKRTVTRITN